jgi:hypothetical protein
MLKSISFKKLAVLTAGLAIVLSSCGLQNQAGDSSDDATAAGKTKNFTLVNGYCYDNVNQWQEANNSLWAATLALEGGKWVGSSEQMAVMSTIYPHFKPDGSWDPNYDGWDEFWAGLRDGVPCPVGTTFAESGSVPVVQLQSNGVPKECYPQDYIDATIAGFEQQRDKADATDAYKAEMQQGIDTTKKTCVKE